MSRLVWDESLSVGVELIDQQHQKWIGHLSDVAGALESLRERLA